MANRYIIQRETQTIGLDVMISRGSIYGQYKGTDRDPAQVGSSNLRYAYKNPSNHSIQKYQRKKWTREARKYT